VRTGYDSSQPLMENLDLDIDLDEILFQDIEGSQPMFVAATSELEDGTLEPIVCYHATSPFPSRPFFYVSNRNNQ